MNPVIRQLLDHFPDSSVSGAVLSTRVRLARNLEGLPFRAKLGESQARALVDTIGPTALRCLDDDQAQLLDLSTCTSLERQVLVERHLISPDLATTSRPAACVLSANERVSVMIGEEDHVRIQVLAPGNDLIGALDRAIELDQYFEHQINWAVHPRFGYLTSCPTNLGTALRASVMLHLPALVRSEEIRSVLRGLSRLHMTVRGVYGEGSETAGHCFQLSNQRTLGMAEETIVEAMDEVTRSIVEHELLARERLLRGRRDEIEDLVHRAIGTLANARLVSNEEASEQFGWLRLGLACQLLPDHLATELPRQETYCRNAHLQLTHPGEAEQSQERSHLRAQLLREWVTSWN